MVLSPTKFEYLTSFEDKDFLNQAFNDSTSRNRWSAARPYETYSSDPLIGSTTERVISISQKAQIPMGREGIVVVNVSVDSLVNFTKSMIDPTKSFLYIEEGNGSVIYSTVQGDEEQRTEMNRLRSDYIRWSFVSGIQSGLFFDWLKVISRIWIVIGVLTIILSLVYTIFITKRNYRPIERIIRQIQAYQNNRSALKVDEFSYIQTVLEKLIDQNVVYEKQVQEDHSIRRKQVFLELIERKETSGDKEWKNTIVQLGITSEFNKAFVAVIEIDQYSNFDNKYNVSDQTLLKFALTNVIQDFFENRNYTTWTEWNRMNRMTVILLNTGEKDHQLLIDTLERFRTWVIANLHFSITVGLGTEVSEWNEIGSSHDMATRALQYKISLGNNRLLQFSSFPSVTDKGTHKYYQKINTIVQEFRMAKQDWLKHVAELFALMQDDLLTNDEVLHLLNYFRSLINKLSSDLPNEVQSHWVECALPQWESAELNESLEEIVPILIDLLDQTYHLYLEIMNSKNNNQLIHQIRQYIEDNYGNQDLSLTHISDKFDMNSKYLSQLFKDQLGVNFGEFLVNLRMEHAKRLLLETKDPINDIALLVGYEIQISFSRTFKKIVGVTPSDYRKNMNG
jgi:AraC-like DNA-binding protein